VLTLISVVVAAIIFEYSNGFHDAANAIATVVSTRVLTPRKAIAMAAFFNLTGALFGGAVASTIGEGLVDTDIVTMTTVLSAVIAAFAWNIATWWFGLPSSSSHALIGGLCGAALASARGNWLVLKWHTGLLPKVIIPMLTSPIAGFLIGGFFMFLLLAVLRTFTPHVVHSIFGKLQLVTAAVIIQAASSLGIPLSTTHVISTSIMGVGAVKRFSGMKWTVVERIVWAWVFTLPVTGLISYLFARAAAAL